MKKRIIPLLLALVLCVGLFAGCQSSELRAYSDNEEDASGTAEESMVKDYTPVYESFAPDTVMLTVNGLDVTWQELFYWYYYDVTSIEAYFGEITDWDAPAAFDETVTYSEYVKNDAFDVARYYRALESKCIEIGLELSDEELAEVESGWQSNVDSYGAGEESFIEYIESLFMSKELLCYFNTIAVQYYALQEEICGEEGEKFDDEEILAKAEELGYMRAKHILLRTVDDENVSISDEEKAKKLALAESLLAELQAIQGSAELDARLDELAAEHNEDPGVEYYPDGYTFLTGEMAAAFETAVLEMGEYGLSGIVETEYGYHIILRLPLSAAAAVEYYSETEAYSLSYYIGPKIFTSMVDAWVEECEVVYSKEYEEMDIAALFAKVELVPAAQ